MIKKNYLKPEMVRIELKLGGIICTSGTGGDDFSLPGEDGDDAWS